MDKEPPPRERPAEDVPNVDFGTTEALYQRLTPLFRQEDGKISRKFHYVCNDIAHRLTGRAYRRGEVLPTIEKVFGDLLDADTISMDDYNELLQKKEDLLNAAIPN